ncbi:hypothetical protein GQE99_19470 [Maritimibacter sp. DP07]|jgi:hypothetical protein|uniref:Uncharacterized protein n=1 Tax=Maritimibacter harenae TaxID=2606218 RepID=A0A845MBI7_9RHOB|nr:hypothetical protein [Maritimibacter harenae]MZR15204.1 hypothetical protein [Maritimibacter harenae]
MAQDKTEDGMDLGIFARQKRSRGMSGAEILAVALCCLWLAGCAVYFLVMGNDGLGGGVTGSIVTLLAVFLPVAVIWLAAATARSARLMHEETLRLQSTIDAMRHNYLTQSHAHHAERHPEVEEKLARLEQAQRETEQALTTFSTTRNLVRAEAAAERPAPARPAEEQPSLALEPEAEDNVPPLERDEMIRALHFPENAEDTAGFAALRRALQDRKIARLVQASQDVLTLMSQDGIYMDDLRPDRARPEIWRRFAHGQRGREVAALGGIRDRSSLALTAGRMKTDPVFRDAAHHFLRRFDEVFVEFEEEASDEDIARLSDTRTARAFMLLGRVTGTFT